MKIKYGIEIEDMDKFKSAYGVVEELCHLYDGINKDKCLAFAHAASYMLEIINGEQNDTKEV